ncbi:MAG TPA: hypothetical protein VK537_00300 [Galbitalea sp.]|nr:hypothetical protein [Galbitalea sp.]
MSMYDDEPELVGYDAGDGRPLRSRNMLIGMRIFVAVGIAGLVLPGVIGEVMLNATDAAESCKRWVNYENPGDSSTVAFELIGAHGSGWQCYTQSDSFGGSQFVASLGWIPGPPQLPTRTGVAA